MNYLAHTYLSHDHEDLLMGNLIGDFIKGRKQFNACPIPIQQGIELHRKIDQFTDRHPIVRKGIERLQPRHGRYASVVVDVFYDYFLAINWPLYAAVPIEDFAQSVYQVINQHFEVIPDRAKTKFQRMVAHNWLVGYQYEERVQYAFDRLAERVSFKSNIKTAVDDMLKHKVAFNEEFNQFFPHLIAYVQEEKQQLRY